MSFALWRSKTGEALTQREWGLFDRAIQETKFKIMADQVASGSEAVERALRERIDGRPLYDVMQNGLQYRLNRILSEKSELERMITENSRLRTRPGDQESADKLAAVRNAQADRMEKLQGQVADAEEDLSELERHSH